MPHVRIPLFGGHADDCLTHARTRSRDSRLFIRSTRRGEHREAELECTELLDIEPERPQEMIAPDLDVGVTDARNDARDEATRFIAALCDRREVVEKRTDVDTARALELSQRYLRTLGEER